MTKHPELFASLAAPFDQREVKKRPQGGRDLFYITARTVMNRLDEVLGPENWFDEYTPGEHSVLCKLTIRLPDGSLLTKADAGGYAGMADEGDDDKSGFSDSFKRAAVKFGIARYLYRDGVPSFASDHAPEAAPATNGKQAAYQPPAKDQRGTYGPGPTSTQPPRAGAIDDHGPRDGRKLFGWCKDMEAKHQVGLIKYINGWAKLQEFPGRMVDWDAEQVRLAHAECVRKLAAIAKGEDPRETARGN
jgi:Rad52/22 family double-strand break repair protein